MQNKILIKLFVPEISFTFDVFIPVNEVVWKVKKILVKSISDLTGGMLQLKNEYILMNKNTNEFYDNNTIILDTNIRNATEIVLFTIK